MALTALGIADGPTPAPAEERSAGDYTDALLASYFAAATGRLQASATAGVQAAAGIVARALASATVEGDGGAVDPHLLEGIGTDLVRAGRFLGRLTVGADGRARILRAGAVASVVYGDADPDSWRYSLSMGGPSSARTVWATAAEVVNVRINADSLRPWEGIAPLARAVASGQLYARLASSLGDEADVVVSRIVPIAQGSGEGGSESTVESARRTAPWPGAISRNTTRRCGCRSVQRAAERFWRDEDRMGGAHLRAATLRAFILGSRGSLRCAIGARESSISRTRGA